MGLSPFRSRFEIVSKCAVSFAESSFDQVIMAFVTFRVGTALFSALSPITAALADS